MAESAQEAKPNQIIEKSAEPVISEETTEPIKGSSRSLQRAVAMVCGLLLLLCISLWSLYSLRPSDPYVQSVLQLTGEPQRGKEIFTLNCAGCHGLDASGEVGPALRNVSERKSRTAAD